jgi:predicted transcriptional regulator
MEAVFDAGEASVAEVLSRIKRPPTYSALRTMLGRLVDKGYLARKQDGFRYMYVPIQTRERGTESALERLLGTVFDSSPTKLVSTLLSGSAGRLSKAELDEMAALIEQARKNS